MANLPARAMAPPGPHVATALPPLHVDLPIRLIQHRVNEEELAPCCSDVGRKTLSTALGTYGEVILWMLKRITEAGEKKNRM